MWRKEERNYRQASSEDNSRRKIKEKKEWWDVISAGNDVLTMGSGCARYR